MKSFKCFNCIDTVYMDDLGDGDWKCPVCGDEYNEYADYDLYADPEPIKPYKQKEQIPMNEQRLKEIINLANTVLPITGSIPNAPELLKETERAIYELEAETAGAMTKRHLIADLRFIHREARQFLEALGENLFTDPNSDRGDHDLK